MLYLSDIAFDDHMMMPSIAIFFWIKSILISAAYRKAFRVSHSARHSSAQYGGGLVAGGASYRDLGSGTPRVIGQHCPCHDITTEHKTEKVSKFGNLQIQ